MCLSGRACRVRVRNLFLEREGSLRQERGDAAAPPANFSYLISYLRDFKLSVF